MSYEVWGEPEDADDPLEHVEHPRERKPWKRDRETVRFAMQLALNERCRANPMLKECAGEPWALSKDHSLRFRELNHFHGEIYRFRLGIGFGSRRSQRLEALARLHRIAELIPYFDRAPLPPIDQDSPRS